MNDANAMTLDQREALSITEELTADLIEFTVPEYCFLFKMRYKLGQYKDKTKLSKKQIYDLRKLRRKRQIESAHGVIK